MNSRTAIFLGIVNNCDLFLNVKQRYSTIPCFSFIIAPPHFTAPKVNPYSIIKGTSPASGTDTTRCLLLLLVIEKVYFVS